MKCISSTCSGPNPGQSSRLVKKYVEPLPAAISSSTMASSTVGGSQPSIM